MTEGPLAHVDAAFRNWFGCEYDLEALHVVLATAAAERLTGDPTWLLLISGSGHTKTETISALGDVDGAHIISTITSEGALLSGTPKREKTKDATGGLLRLIGARGLLVIKDVTSLLSMHRDTRAAVLAALREIYDGRWTRNIGTDGGRSLMWQGRIAVIGACTTAWDRAHDVIATMGDRFVVVRTDSTRGRLTTGRQAIANTGLEPQMRAELADTVSVLLSGIDPHELHPLNDADREALLKAADIVTLARTGVDYDYRGDVIDAHQPEAPTRFAKQLYQIFRGALAIGIDRPGALRLALRCARDSMPPLRLAILDDVAAHPGTLTTDVRRRLQKPRTTVDRQLQALHMLGVLACDEDESVSERFGKIVTHWRYRLADGIDPTVLPRPSPDLSPHVDVETGEERLTTDISGADKDASR
jgi:hypothetical protein